MLKLRALPIFPFMVLREGLSPRIDARIPEPMLMEEPESVAQWHEAGAGTGVNIPVHDLCARATSRLLPEGGTVFDLGCGSGQYLAYLARRRPDVRIIGIDLSAGMLEAGRRAFEEEGLSGRVTLLRGDITAFSDLLPGQVDLISSVYSLHHLPSKELLARCLGEMAAARDRTGCALWVYDLARLKHPRTYSRFLSLLPDVKPFLLRDALNSERAAWSVAELNEGLQGAGLGDLQRSVSRLLPAFQIAWARGRGHPAAGAFREVPVSRQLRAEVRVLRAMMPGLP